MITIIDADLRKINEERKRRGLRVLNHLEAHDALIAVRQYSDSVDVFGFLVGYGTGISTGSIESTAGAMLHHATSVPETGTPSLTEINGGGGSSGGAGASADYSAPSADTSSGGGTSGEP